MNRLVSILVFCLAPVWLLSGCQSNQPRPAAAGGSGTEVDMGVPIQPSPADVYVGLAAGYLREGNLPVALQNAEAAVRKDPNSANAHNIAALVYQRLGQNREAEKAFRRALAIVRTNPYIDNAYGSFLCGQKRYDEAHLHFLKAMRHPLNRTPWLAQTNAGICLQEQDRLEEAEDQFRAALRGNSKLPVALYNMAKLSFVSGKYLSTRAYLQRYQEVAAHTAESLWLGIQAERQLGNMDQVASYELLLRAKFPDSVQAKHLKE